MTALNVTRPVEYRQDPDFLNYRVGDDGSAQSTFANGLLGGRVCWRPLKPQRHSGGYLVVHFYKDGKRYPKFLHRLVLELFVGPCPEGMEACHMDGDRTNNRAENLRWDTRAGNHADKRIHGTLIQGSDVYGAKLHESVIPVIRRLLEMGIYQWQVAQAFEVEPALVSQIATGKIWKHVQ
jgi:hypothetical protein